MPNVKLMESRGGKSGKRNFGPLDGYFTGETMEEVEAHRKGVLHGGNIIMLIDREGVVLAKRADTKYCWPGYWDISVAAHPYDVGTKGPGGIMEKYNSGIEETFGITGLRWENLEYGSFYYKAKCPVTGMHEHEWCRFGLAYYNGVVKEQRLDIMDALGAKNEISAVTHIKDIEEFRKFDFETMTPRTILFVARIPHKYLEAINCFIPDFGLNTIYV